MLVFTSPAEPAAFVLVDVIPEHCHADTARKVGGTWEIRVALDKAPRSTVPTSLEAAAEWLDQCGLSLDHRHLGDDTHVLMGTKTARASNEPVPSGEQAA
jgi:hypothetical protein